MLEIDNSVSKEKSLFEEKNRYSSSFEFLEQLTIDNFLIKFTLFKKIASIGKFFFRWKFNSIFGTFLTFTPLLFATFTRKAKP